MECLICGKETSNDDFLCSNDCRVEMKHVLALTYKPKIPDVRAGKCTQTIRPCSQRPRRKDDLIMFHGWSDKPYRSKWNWRTPYWKIVEVFPIMIGSDFCESDPFLWDKLHDMDKEEMNDLAVRDGFKNFDEMYKQFELMYGNELEDMVFEVLRWNPTGSKGSIKYHAGPAQGPYEKDPV